MHRKRCTTMKQTDSCGYGSCASNVFANTCVVGLLNSKLNSFATPQNNFSSTHCIFHQEAMRSKIIEIKEVIEVVKTVKRIKSQTIFFSESVESEYGESYHTEVRRLRLKLSCKHRCFSVL